MRKIILIGFLVTFFSGCSNTLYYWGNSLEDSYEYAVGDYTTEEYLNRLLAMELEFDASHKAPPNFYSEIGALYLKQGDVQKAKEYFVKEKETWPDSTLLMDKLVSNL